MRPEGILGGELDLAPRLPRNWPQVEAVVSLGGGRLRVTIENPDGPGAGTPQIEVDGALWNSGPIPFPQDGSERVVRARIGPLARVFTQRAGQALTFVTACPALHG